MFRNYEETKKFLKEIDPDYNEQKDKLTYLLFNVCYARVAHNKYERSVVERMQNIRYCKHVGVGRNRKQCINIEQILLDFTDEDFIQLYNVGPKRVKKLINLKRKLKKGGENICYFY